MDALPVFDRSTAAGRAIYNTYHLKADRQRQVEISRRRAPPKREVPRPIEKPKPVGTNPAKAKVAVPKFRGGPRREFHRIDFVDHRKSQAKILTQNNFFEEESAPSNPCPRSNDDRNKELQLKFEYGQEYDIATKQRPAKKIVRDKAAEPVMSATERDLKEVTMAIEERTQFLEEMHASSIVEYDAQIKGQLAQLLKEAQALETKLDNEKRLEADPSADL